jgi:hypothetical protein
MTPFATFVRAAGCTTVMLGLASACGGQSFKGGEAGEAGSGGTTQTAGNSNRAGSKATAGSSSSGGSGTTGGSGSTIDREACTGPSDDNLDGSGCAAYFLRWTHDEATGLCVPTVYGGCGATKNNYETLAACQQACPGGSPNYDTCQVATDCVLGSTGCCGVCDGPDVTAHDFIAYNKQYEAEARQCVGDVACGACAPVDPQRNTRQFFIPNCVRGECVVEDIRESDVSACTTADDCRLRNGTGCCEGCGPSDFVAVRNDGSLTKLVCGELIPPCAACEPQPPEGAAALCSSRGHCIVNYIVND